MLVITGKEGCLQSKMNKTNFKTSPATSSSPTLDERAKVRLEVGSVANRSNTRLPRVKGCYLVAGGSFNVSWLLQETRADSMIQGH